MSDSDNTETSHSTRRDFIKYSLLGGAALLTGIGLKRTIETGRSGLESDLAHFFPIYEQHFAKFNPELLPAEFDYFFVEWGGTALIKPDEHGYVPPDKFARISAIGLDEKRAGELYRKLDAARAKIVLGDIDPSVSMESAIVMQMEELMLAKLLWKDEEGQFRKDSAPIDRRVFIKRLLAAWLISPQLVTPLGLAHPLYQHNGAVRRVAERLVGVTMGSHPENVWVFFRNLVIASKLFATAEKHKNTTGAKPRIVYNLGVGHSGIEDLLMLGPDFVSLLIDAYPKEFIEHVLQRYKRGPDDDGIEAFSRVRLISVPELKSDEVYKANWPGSSEEWFVDERLQTTLRKK